MTHVEIERGDVVERYLLGRLTPREEAEFEDHFLLCRQCQKRQQEESPLLGELLRGCVAWAGSPRPQRRSWFLPVPAWGLAAALGAAAVYVSLVLPVREPRPAAVETAQFRLPVVELSVFRAGSGEVGRVKAGEPFALRLDARGLAAGSDYSLEIAAEAGGVVWSQAGVTVGADRADARVARSLPRGLYWVRLSRQGQLVREYELRAGD
jgi:hypothetical protein